jgi:outer membrane immunogenic protein
MKKILLSFVAFAALTTSPAMGADLPIYNVKNRVLPIVYTGWNGIYFGGNIGYTWGRHDVDWSLFGFPATSDQQNMNGVIGGYQSGINWQTGNWMTGIEIDAQWSGQKSSPTSCVATCDIASVAATHKLPWFGTARTRFGFSPGTYTYLFYLTTGVAYGRVQSDYVLSLPAGAVAGFSFDHTSVGWTAGAGIEVAVSGNWTAKLEYLYLDLGTNTSTFAIAAVNPAASVATLSSRVTDNIVRLGVNYQFSPAR